MSRIAARASAASVIEHERRIQRRNQQSPQHAMDDTLALVPAHTLVAVARRASCHDPARAMGGPQCGRRVLLDAPFKRGQRIERIIETTRRHVLGACACSVCVQYHVPFFHA